MTRLTTLLSSLSHYSCLESTLSPKAIVESAVKLGYTSCGIADYNSMSACVEFYKECKNAGIKPILGMRDVTNDVAYFARNKAGYIELLGRCYDINTEAKTGPHSDNVICVNDQQAFLPTPRFRKDSARLFNILYATQKRKPLKTLGDELAQFADDYIERSDAAPQLIRDTNEIADSIEEYDIFSKPMLPRFNGHENDVQLFTDLCYAQLNREFPGSVEYDERLKFELKVLVSAGLANYFLVLMDIMQYAERSGFFVGAARGSSAGSLVAYLLGITKIDPIKNGLLFSRFYNDGRNNENYTAMPDIDVDVPKRSRAQITQYISDKYGADRVCKIATYQTMMGRAAISAVTRAMGTLSFSETKEVTKYIKDKAKISDQLEAMKQAGEQPSVILWALQNEGGYIENYCKLKRGKLTGPLATEFQIAIELEGIKCALSEHAAGVVISRDPLRGCCPMIRNDQNLIAGCEMEELELIGAQKLDLLALSSLDRVEDI